MSEELMPVCDCPACRTHEESLAWEIIGMLKEQNKRLEDAERRHSKQMVTVFIVSVVMGSLLTVGILYYFYNLDFTSTDITNEGDSVTTINRDGEVVVNAQEDED